MFTGRDGERQLGQLGGGLLGKERTVADRPYRPAVPKPHGQPLSRDAVAARITRYNDAASGTYPSLHDKVITPHTLRHTNAMALHRAGVDIAGLALWLGHSTTRSTDVYLHADIEAQRTSFD
ncbi:tyrosine-type recombinase/integrase [Nonomuraea sp. NPDC049400]|uniref:tyrosine-type recombinase/integrase n=1 Tax=Nonomuraea sp. NPDC049400 TaxID=3364352 RepID=UPI0037A4DD39